MARRAVLGGGSLNPFGGAGVDFGSFNIGPSPTSAADTASEVAAAAKREAQLTLNAAEIRWNAGQISNAEYLAALGQYSTVVDSQTTSGQDAIARVDTYRLRFERDQITSAVENGSASLIDLLNFDRNSLSGLVQDSEEYQQRLGYYRSTQNALFSERESALVDQYNKGQMTTAQLNESYLALGNDSLFNDSPQIRQSVEGRLSDLADRVLAEVDSQMLSDYQAGKITPQAFIAYGNTARSRYVAGTEQFNSWTERLTDASDRSKETALLYRYDLSQKYAQLQKFIQSSGPLAGGTSTSKSTRQVLNADGVTWRTVTTTTTKAVAPSASEVAAYAARQAEVASAKLQMAEIEAKMLANGGYVSTDSTIIYYQRQLAKFAPGSDEWYSVQGKLDDLADRKSMESLLASQGIRVSYPKTPAQLASVEAVRLAKGGAPTAPPKDGGGTTGSDTANTTLEQFMAAIAKVESGGRYTAQNATSGAFGKYQIMPANWAGWAKAYLGDATAAQTPENQEKVAAGKMAALYKWLGDWRAVAHWWLTGGSKETQTNPAAWSASSRKYVDNVMAGVGAGPTSGSTLAANAQAAGRTATPTGGTSRPMQAPAPVATAKPVAAAKPTSGPLRILTGAEEFKPQNVGLNGRDFGGAPGVIIPTIAAARFPTDLSGKAFDAFYKQYQTAFQVSKGAPTSFTVTNEAGTVAYWIGDDPAERRDLMRGMDELRINKARDAMLSYDGTLPMDQSPQAVAYNQAVEDAARHELMILATAGTATADPLTSPNPLAQGITILDRAKVAIADLVTLADAAIKRGDPTAAYSYLQMARAQGASADRALTEFAQIAEANTAAIELASGKGRDEALGVDRAASFGADMERLNNFGLELDVEVNKSDETLVELLKVVRKDPRGEPMFDSPGPGGQLSLSSNFHWELKGKNLVAVASEPTLDVQSGTDKLSIPNKVYVDYLVGGKPVAVYVDYVTDKPVGWFVDAKTGMRVDIMGKTYLREKDDGTFETWREDPFTGTWSSTPIVYTPGSGFAAVMGKNGQPVIQYAGGGTIAGPQGQTRPDGYTYSMAYDPATGTYIGSRVKAKSLLGGDAVEEVLGSVRPGSAAYESFGGAGFSRDLSSLSVDERGFAQMGAPFSGGTVKQYRDYKFNFQSPFKNLIGAKAPGGIEDVYSSKTRATIAALTGGAPRPAPAPPRVSVAQQENVGYVSPSLPTLSALRPTAPLPKTVQTGLAAGLKTPIAATIAALPGGAPKPAVVPKPETRITAPVKPAPPKPLPVSIAQLEGGATGAKPAPYVPTLKPY